MKNKEETGQEIVAQTKTQVIKAGTSLFFDIAKFDHAQRVAKVFATSTMVPEQFKDNIGNCIIALNLADRMKVDPFMLMQNMYIVHGKPGIEAKLAIALVNNSGKFTPLQYKYNHNKTSCYAYSQKTDTGEVCEGVEVSIQMAKDEGWHGKSGSKWKTMPALMLMYRSAMFFARAYCPEALLGMQTKEELYDIVDMEAPTQKNGAYKLKNAKVAIPRDEVTTSKTKPTEEKEEKKETIATPPAFAALVKAEANKDYSYVASSKEDGGLAHDNLSAYIEMCVANSPGESDNTPEDAMNAIVESNSFAGFWSGFLQGGWKKHFEGKLPGKKPTAKPEEEKEPETTNGNANAFDSEDWDHNRLKAKGLSTFFYTNKDNWNKSSAESKAAFRNKWGRVYGETEPFPIENVEKKEEKEEAQENTGAIAEPLVDDTVIDYASKLREYYETEPEKLLAVCKQMNYNDMVIPMGKSSQKALYEMFQKVNIESVE